MECRNTHRHNSVTGRLVLYRKKGDREDGEDLQTHPSPVLSSAVVGPLDVLPIFFFCLFVSLGGGGRMAGWESRSKHSFLVQCEKADGRGGMDGGKEERETREGGMSSGERTG